MTEIRAGPETVLFLSLRKRDGTVNEILMQTYTIALPVLLGYIVWLLKNQKRDRVSQQIHTAGRYSILRLSEFLRNVRGLSCTGWKRHGHKDEAGNR